MHGNVTPWDPSAERSTPGGIHRRGSCAKGGPVVPCCDRHTGICLSWLLTDLSEGNKFPMKSHFSLVSLDAHGYNFPYGAKVVQRKSRA